MESAKTMRRFVTLAPFAAPTVLVVNFDSDAARSAVLLAEAADYCRAHGLEVETASWQEGPKGRLLEKAYDWGADLLVLGNSARQLLLRKLFGETMLQTLRESRLPMFLSQ